MKCAWCGKDNLQLTHKGRPQQHLNGKTTCCGSAQLAATHQRLRDAAAANLKGNQ